MEDGTESANAVVVEVFDQQQLARLVRGAAERGLRFEVHP